MIADGGSSGARLVKGRKRATGEPVAIKIWRQGAPEGIRECRLWERTGSDCFKEFGTDGERLILVRRWFPGENLAEIVGKSGTFSTQKTIGLLAAIADRLSWFYGNLGSCFGDLKPENIIFDGEKVYLIDFESCEEISSGTKAGARRTLRLMTIGFAAPEMAAGKPEQASDFYSLAMIGVFLLSGDTDAGLLRCDNPGLEGFIRRNLSTAPSERCGSIDEIRDALRKIGAGEMPFEDETPKNSVLQDAGRDLGKGPGSGPGIGLGNGNISVENMNVKASRIIFTGPQGDSGEDPAEGGDKGGADRERIAADDAAQERGKSGRYYPGAENAAEVVDDSAGGDAGELREGEHGFSAFAVDDSFPEDRGIPFPHVEKGYRRLLLYVPGNIMFASELSYVLAACFGFRTLLCEFTDCTESRVKYYFDHVNELSPGEGDVLETRELSGNADGAPPARQINVVVSSIASEESPAYGPENADNTANALEGHVGGTGSAANAGESLDSGSGRVSNAAGSFDRGSEISHQCVENPENVDSERCIFGAGGSEHGGSGGADYGFRFRIFEGSFNRNLHSGCSRIKPGAVYSDGEVLEFVSAAYANYDMTVVCDGTFESGGTRDRFLRFCDYIVVPVDGDADSIERDLRHCMWVLRSNRISAGKLKTVGWEYEEKNDADVKLLAEADGRARHLGNISFDSRRHRLKNRSGGFYCEHMPWRIIREYMTVAGLLTYGDDVCA